jgi:NAD(P)-dependent dehydrogenase (short-subunit alcohol dehydrogenase family)
VPKAIDVTNESQYRAAITEAESTFGPVSFLFSNAGIGGAHKALVDLSLDELDAIMSVSFRAVFIGMKYALPAIKRAGGGAILNCGSLLSFKGAPRRRDYAAAKHAVIALTKTAAGEHAQDRIQINCLCPGLIDTALQHASEVSVNPADPNYERRRFESAIPMGRYGTPEEVADLAAFLLSGAVPYLTGVAIPLDGARRCDEPTSIERAVLLSGDIRNKVLQRHRMAGIEDLLKFEDISIRITTVSRSEESNRLRLGMEGNASFLQSLVFADDVDHVESDVGQSGVTCGAIGDRTFPNRSQVLENLEMRISRAEQR